METLASPEEFLKYETITQLLKKNKQKLKEDIIKVLLKKIETWPEYSNDEFENWYGKHSLKVILSRLGLLCEIMGNEKFLWFSKNRQANNIATILKGYRNWGGYKLKTNALKVATDIRKIKELKEVGEKLAGKLEREIKLDEKENSLLNEMEKDEKNTRRITHQRLLYILNQIGSVGVLMLSHYKNVNATTEDLINKVLNKGNLDSDCDILATAEKLNDWVGLSNIWRLSLHISDKFTSYPGHVHQLECAENQMMNLLSKEWEQMTGKNINLTRKEKNEIYARLEAEGQSLGTKKIITTIITVLDRNFKPDEKLVDTLVKKLKDTLAKPLEELTKRIP